MADKLKDSLANDLAAYGTLGVVGALIFGFSISILDNTLRTTYKQTTNTAQNFGFCFGAVATGASMLATMTFVWTNYFGFRLLAMNEHRAETFLESNYILYVAKGMIILSLICLVGQIVANAFANSSLEPNTVWVVTTILGAFLLALMSMLASQLYLYKKQWDSEAEA